MSVEKARETLWASRRSHQIRNPLRARHPRQGRAPGRQAADDQKPRQHLAAPAPQVLGFTSCQARHGGAGAVYVMLKRTMMEGRDE
jgi:DNA-nicking Smr family endonuclease